MIAGALSRLRGALGADAVQYAVRLGDGTVLKDGDLFSRRAQELRLLRYQEIWPEADLITRNVYYGEWKETDT